MKPSPQQSMFMRPGEYVGYVASNKKLIKRVVDTNLYTSWINNQLVFRKTTLKEIALLLEDNYGYQVIFKDDRLAQSRFTGTIPDDNINLLFTALSKLYDLQISQINKKIIITPNSLK